MKKILFIHQSRAYAGTDAFAINMITGLKENGYNVEVILNSDNVDILNFYKVCTTHVYKYKLLTIYTLSGYKRILKKIFILLGYPIIVLIHLLDLYKQVKTIMPDRIILINAGIPGAHLVYSGAIICGLLKINTLYTVHNDVVYNPFIKPYAFIVEFVVTRFKNIRFVSVSNYNIQRIITRSFFIRNVHLVYNGVNCNKLKAKLSTKKETPYFNIVFVGNISNQKGVRLLIDAFQSLDVKLNCKLYLYGKIVDECLYQYVKAQCNAKDNIELIINQHDKDIIFKEKDLLVLPSTSLESFGQVLIEAMCHGVPVIGSDDLGIKEVIEIDDSIRAGDTFELGSRVSLANTITTIVRNKTLYSIYKKNANSLFEKYFKKEIMIRNYIKLLE